MYFGYIISYALSVVKCIVKSCLNSISVIIVLYYLLTYAIISTMDRKLIVDESGATSQGDSQAGYPTDGLRLLAGMIACDLMARQSGYENSKKYQNANSQLKVATSLKSEANTQVRKAK